MKGITYTSITLMLFLVFNSGCYIDLGDDDHLLGPVIRGSGYVVTEDRFVADFDRIAVEGTTHVILRQGEEQIVQVEADDNIIPVITTSVRGSELRIENQRRYRTNHEVTIYITVPVIRSLALSGSGNIYGETPIAGDQLAVEISGSGNIDLELYYTKLFAEGNGSGDFQMFGEVDEQEIKISGSGNYHAKDLLSQSCYIKISGSGTAEVNVSDVLNAEIIGSGDIIYYGNPQVSSSVRGSGNVVKG